MVGVSTFARALIWGSLLIVVMIVNTWRPAGRRL
jgi:ribose/xylose/arabinose/galactoside ABC-type transport system permease subunit